MNALKKILSWITRPIYGGIGTILMFHRVVPASLGKRRPENTALEITPEALEQVIRFFIERKYEFASLNRVHEILATGEHRRRFAAFTFDDGYADVLVYGYPVFKKYNVPFAVNLISGFPDRQVVLWWYLLEEILLTRPEIHFELEGVPYHFDLTSPQGADQAAQQVRRLVKFATPQELERRLQAIFSPHYDDLYQKTTELALSWEQVRRIVSDPLVTISAHTAHHYALSKLDETTAREEIMGGKARIEEELQREVRHFAYPYGSPNEAGRREFALAEKCGFQTAATTRFANVFRAHRKHLHALPRLEISRLGGLSGLELAVNGFSTLRRNRMRRVISE
ncbi:MAG: polysaccharide deacetylase family protein [Anaerolineaceae bacterium]|nr:polysaccharide deacetylase family protein [Anaerolineaceae bacterium]